MCKYKVGDRVTLTKPMEAYYSGYAGNPVVFITPGTKGTVTHIDMPPVRGWGKLYCIDFVLPVVSSEKSPYPLSHIWRVAARLNEMRKICA